MGCAVRDPEFNLPFFPIRASLRLFLRSWVARACRMSRTSCMRGLTDPLLAVRAALAGEQLRLWRAGEAARCVETCQDAPVLPALRTRDAR